MNQPAEVLFGHGSLPVILPEGCRGRVIAKPQMPVLSNPVQALGAAMEAPIGCPSLSELASTAKSVCILICDITRPVPNGLILPRLIEALLASGVESREIVVLVATGLHRPNLGEELRRLAGSDWVLDTVRLENHYAHDQAAHMQLGVTSRGTCVKLDRRFVEADLKIATGLVEPHFMAGYSGGRKVVSPGIASAETIETLHNTRFMEDPASRNCNIEGNPLHEEQLEIVRMLGTVYAINTCLDAKRRLAFINFGEILESHREAVAFLRPFAEVPLEQRYRSVITSCAGYPLDLTFYQTVKGIIGAVGALEKGGTLLIASECAEGVGSPGFCAAQSVLVEKGSDAFLKEARSRALARMDEWTTVKLIEVLRDYRVHLYATGLDESQRRLTGVTCHDDWNEALSALLAEGDSAEVAVIPEGPYVVPLCSFARHSYPGSW
jgi:nickel-dependent lactate racemase